jgi:glucan phosphorylase
MFIEKNRASTGFYVNDDMIEKVERITEEVEDDRITYVPNYKVTAPEVLINKALH